MVAKKVIRMFAKAYYREGKFYRVPLGPIKGARLVYSKGTPYRFMIGLYDHAYMAAAEKMLRGLDVLRPGWCAADLGANVGYFTAWLARLSHATKGRQIYSFEPDEKNLKQLKENVAVNGWSNLVTVVDSLVADRDGFVDFFRGENMATGSTLFERAVGSRSQDHVEKFRIKSTTLDTFFLGPDGVGVAPDFLKIDIEGAGTTALKYMEKCIAKQRPIILFESHTFDEDAAVSALLTKLNYSAYRLNRAKWVSPGDEVGGTMLLVPQEKQTRAASLLAK